MDFGFGGLGWGEQKALLIKLQLAGTFSTKNIPNKEGFANK